MITSYGECQAYLGKYDETTSKMYHTYPRQECGRQAVSRYLLKSLRTSCPGLVLFAFFLEGTGRPLRKPLFRGKERCDRTRHNVGIGIAKARSFTSTSLLHIRQRFFGLSFFLSMVHKKSTNSIILRQ